MQKYTFTSILSLLILIKSKMIDVVIALTVLEMCDVFINMVLDIFLTDWFFRL